MYKSFTVSTLLACLAYTPLAVKLHEFVQIPMIAGMEELNMGNSVDEAALTNDLTVLVEDATKEKVLEEPDASKVLDEFNENLQIIEDVVEEHQDADDEDDCACNGCQAGCACDCEDDENDMLIHLPGSVYEDGRIAVEAENIVQALDPLVIDLTLADLDMDLLDAENLEQDVLLPAMQKALEALIAADPSLADQLPSLPTQLDSAVDAVMAIVQANNDTHEATMEGATVTQMSSAGSLESFADYEKAMTFSSMSPVLFWFVDNACSQDGGVCAPFGQMSDNWKDLQGKAVGTLFLKVNIDEMSDIADIEGVTSAPYYKSYLNSEVMYENSLEGVQWSEFQSIITGVNKQVADAANMDSDTTYSSESMQMDWDTALEGTFTNNIGTTEGTSEEDIAQLMAGLIPS